jgi:RimJ/RimL family protein N-acetyltransferase
VRLILGQDELLGRWVSEQIGRPFKMPDAAIGWVGSSGALVGACAFHNYEIHNIDLAVATVRPVTRGAIRAICHYVFAQLNCQRITIRMRKSDKRGIRSAHKLGFQFETTLDRWYGAEKGVQLKMLRETCRWI